MLLCLYLVAPTYPQPSRWVLLLWNQYFVPMLFPGTDGALAFAMLAAIRSAGLRRVAPSRTAQPSTRFCRPYSQVEEA